LYVNTLIGTAQTLKKCSQNLSIQERVQVARKSLETADGGHHVSRHFVAAEIFRESAVHSSPERLQEEGGRRMAGSEAEGQRHPEHGRIGQQGVVLFGQLGQQLGLI
jgi:hypothetical protein